MIEILSIRALRGPNAWARCPVLELAIRLDQAQDPAPMQRLSAWRTNQAAAAGLLLDLAPDAGPAEVLARLALDLQTLAGSSVSICRTRHSSPPGRYAAACEYGEAAVGLACCESARALLAAVLAGEACNLDGELARLRELGQEIHLGPSTAAIAEAARARDIPVRRLGRNSLLLLGQGARQRRVWTAETDRTGAIAEAIAQDKDLTRLLLGSVGVPVPQGRAVTSAEDAWTVAQGLGLPVVIKPRFGNHGRGISANLHSREQVDHAYAAALEESDDILCERHIQGADHRLLVVGGRMVAAALREPAQVVGDGQATVAELVERVNADPRRSDGHATVLSRIKLDTIALAVLAEQGYTPESVPAAGAKVPIRTTANLSTGGTATDVTDQVHPEVAARAVDAALAVGLDIAGVDILARDISQPLEAQGGAVVEVNAGPGLRMHLEPSAGAPRPVGEAIIELLFPHGLDGRIPVVAATGSSATAVTELVEEVLRRHGAEVGLTNAAGRVLGGRRVGDTDSTGLDAPCAAFLNPGVDVAVLEVQPDEIVEHGLGFDRCRVLVVTDLAGYQGADDPALDCLLATVEPGGVTVLPAEATWAAALAERCRGTVLWVSGDPEHPLIQGQRAQGGRTLVTQDGDILLVEGKTEQRVPILMSPTTTDAAQVADALATAAAWAFGVHPSTLHAVLEDGSARDTGPDYTGEF